ncbi:unnamed protein product [Cuscuta campestris]|uniref:WEB family protein n=2 Tax=Cuscuta sect. Cleistogrammica TaxID=1824901 RepID=A0A484M089_9ASTE|nr:unnamed protein product [Cuscuta campestris]
MHPYMEAPSADGGSGGPGTAMERKAAEIDTSSPFRSVKEAVLLFGDTLLARQLYPNNASLQQKEEAVPPKLSSVRAELEETKQRLQKAKEESFVMATCLSSLQDELRRTKTELHLLKQQSQRHESEAEDLKFIEAPAMIDLQLHKSSPEIIECDNVMRFERKKYVSFSRRHHFPAGEDDNVVLERHPSLKKKKKKPVLIPLMAIGGIFSRKKSH